MDVFLLKKFMKHTFTLTFAESDVLFFLILRAVPRSGKCQLLSFMASKIGWIMKRQWKLASRWRSLVKSFGFLRFLSLHHYLSVLLPLRVSAFTRSFVCIFLKTFTWILREFYFCLNAGWTLCVHRQLKRFPFSCFACLPQISLTWSWFWFWFIAWRFDISLEER